MLGEQLLRRSGCADSGDYGRDLEAAEYACGLNQTADAFWSATRIDPRHPADKAPARVLLFPPRRHLRVNNVRLSGEFVKSASTAGREIEGFYDNSLWESKKGYGDDAIKDLIRDGVKNSSAVCVLVGTDTWARRWVRYEIARAIIDGRGLLAVHVNGLNHHQLRIPHPFGENPLNWLGVGKVQPILQTGPTYYLYEKKTRWNGLR